MTAFNLPAAAAAADAPAAVTAFLRGVERRGAVFAELLCGDPARGDAALAVALRAFARTAAPAAVADWPRRFWSLLVAVPQLRSIATPCHWPATLAVMAGHGTGPRAALLLRLLAGLAEADAAAVLGIAEPTYRRALQRALPRLADGRPDPAGCQGLAEALQLLVRQLPIERLARLRDAAHPDGRPRRVDSRRQLRGERVRGERVRGANPPWWGPACWTVLAIAALAFGATFFLPPASDVDLPRAVPLAAADAPASSFDADTALLTHPDFDQLADQLADPHDAALVRDVDFYAWYSAQLASQPVGAPLLLPDAAAPLTGAAPGGHDASP